MPETRSAAAQRATRAQPATLAGEVSRQSTAGLGTRTGGGASRLRQKLHAMPPVLSSMQLRNLSEHAYSAQGNTLLDPLFQPFWRWLVERVPLWVSPNLLTVIGLVINVVTSAALALLSPDARSEQVIPRICFTKLLLPNVLRLIYQRD